MEDKKQKHTEGADQNTTQKKRKRRKKGRRFPKSKYLPVYIPIYAHIRETLLDYFTTTGKSQQPVHLTDRIMSFYLHLTTLFYRDKKTSISYTQFKNLVQEYFDGMYYDGKKCTVNQWFEIITDLFQKLGIININYRKNSNLIRNISILSPRKHFYWLYRSIFNNNFDDDINLLNAVTENYLPVGWKLGKVYVRYDAIEALNRYPKHTRDHALVMLIYLTQEETRPISQRIISAYTSLRRNAKHGISEYIKISDALGFFYKKPDYAYMRVYAYDDNITRVKNIEEGLRLYKQLNDIRYIYVEDTGEVYLIIGTRYYIDRKKFGAYVPLSEFDRTSLYNPQGLKALVRQNHGHKHEQLVVRMRSRIRRAVLERLASTGTLYGLRRSTGHEGTKRKYIKKILRKAAGFSPSQVYTVSRKSNMEVSDVLSIMMYDPYTKDIELIKSKGSIREQIIGALQSIPTLGTIPRVVTDIRYIAFIHNLHKKLSKLFTKQFKLRKNIKDTTLINGALHTYYTLRSMKLNNRFYLPDNLYNKLLSLEHILKDYMPSWTSLYGSNKISWNPNKHTEIIDTNNLRIHTYKIQTSLTHTTTTISYHIKNKDLRSKLIHTLSNIYNIIENILDQYTQFINKHKDQISAYSEQLGKAILKSYRSHLSSKTLEPCLFAFQLLVA